MKNKNINTWTTKEIEQGFAIRRVRGRTLVYYIDGTVVHYSKYVETKKDYLKKNIHSGKFKKTNINNITSEKVINKLYDYTIQEELEKDLPYIQSEIKIYNDTHKKILNSASYIKRKNKENLELQYQLDEDRRWKDDR